jgi:hypothetical protein
LSTRQRRGDRTIYYRPNYFLSVSPNPSIEPTAFGSLSPAEPGELGRPMSMAAYLPPVNGGTFTPSPPIEPTGPLDSRLIDGTFTSSFAPSPSAEPHELGRLAPDTPDPPHELGSLASNPSDPPMPIFTDSECSKIFTDSKTSLACGLMTKLRPLTGSRFIALRAQSGQYPSPPSHLHGDRRGDPEPHHHP